MFFYKKKSDKSNARQMLLNINYSESNLHSTITNDYYKYYMLLVKCEFFEHLTMDFDSIQNKIKEITLDLNEFTNLKNGYENGRYLHTIGDYFSGGFDTIVDIYYIFSNAIYNLDTNILVSLFYNYNSLGIINTARSIMENTEHNYKLKIKQGMLSQYYSFYSPDWEYINISNHFIFELISGNLIHEDKNKDFIPINET